MGEYNGRIGGVDSIVARGFAPWWEGMDGTVAVTHVEDEISPREAFKLALDWLVVERPLFVAGYDSDGDIELQAVPNKKAVVREDTGVVLGVHSESYGVVQNEVLCELLEQIKLVGDDVQIRSAGALFDGQVTWMLAKLGEDTHFAGQDETIAKYLLAASSHDGTVALSTRNTNVRVECMNTFDWAIKESPATVQLRHTSKVSDYIEQAKAVVRMAYSHSVDIDAEIRQMLATPLSAEEFRKHVIPEIAGKQPRESESARTHTLWENRTDKLWAAYNRPDQANITGTAWGAIMGVNSYELWSQTVRGISRNESQAKRAINGDFPLTQKVRAFLRKYLGV